MKHNAKLTSRAQQLRRDMTKKNERSGMPIYANIRTVFGGRLLSDTLFWIFTVRQQSLQLNWMAPSTMSPRVLLTIPKGPRSWKPTASGFFGFPILMSCII